MPIETSRLQLFTGLPLLPCGVSFPLAYAADRFLQFNFAAPFVVIVLALTFGLIASCRHFRGKDAGMSEANRSRSETIERTQAEMAARAMLSDSSKFHVVRDPVDDFPSAGSLADHLRAFFLEIASIKAVRGDAELQRHSIAPSQLNSNYIRLGTDIESVQVVVLPNEEAIYELDTFEPDEPFDRHPSNDHWILATGRSFYED